MNCCRKLFVDRDEQKMKQEGGRQRWMGRWTFIMASVGSAIGLGNFWRFPYLTYRHGGAQFFIPYLLSLFFMGIPLLILEVSLGQKFQRGDIGVFRGIHPRLAGIGLASVFSAVNIAYFYTVIIAWALFYFFKSFEQPLQWSAEYWAHRPEFTCGHGAETYFYKDVIEYQNHLCRDFAMGDQTFVVGRIFGALCITWVCIFLCIFNGVKSSSWVVWVTVPLPVCIIICLIARGATLPGSYNGIRWYLAGEEIPGADAEDGGLSSNSIWPEAAGQIFFSIGVCMGIMTSYGSYNPVDQPIISNSFIIALTNSFVSFLSGFAVFSVAGYIQETTQEAPSTKSIGLAFVAFPTAMSEMPGANFWNVILFLNLFLLGIDSAFSMIEATSTVIYDQWKGIPRMLLAFVLCAIGALAGLVYASNAGLVALDVIDHYINVYCMILLGILQCFGVGWIHEVSDNIQKHNIPKSSYAILALGFWIPLILFCVIALFALDELAPLGLLLFLICFGIAFFVSFKKSGKTYAEYNQFVAMCGVRRLSKAITRLMYTENDTEAQRKRKDKMALVFEYWWGISIKYLIPAALVWVMVLGLKGDIDSPYEGYEMEWQVIGFLFPIINFICFLVPIFICTKQDKFEHNLEAAFAEAPIGAKSEDAPAHAGQVAAAPAEPAKAEGTDGVDVVPGERPADDQQ